MNCSLSFHAPDSLHANTKLNEIRPYLHSSKFPDARFRKKANAQI